MRIPPIIPIKGMGSGLKGLCLRMQLRRLSAQPMHRRSSGLSFQGKPCPKAASGANVRGTKLLRFQLKVC